MRGGRESSVTPEVFLAGLLESAPPLQGCMPSMTTGFYDALVVPLVLVAMS